jgi:hypothetical protein
LNLSYVSGSAIRSAISRKNQILSLIARSARSKELPVYMRRNIYISLRVIGEEK